MVFSLSITVFWMSSMLSNLTPFKSNLKFKNMKYSKGLLSGECGGWWIVGICLSARSGCLIAALCAGALSRCGCKMKIFEFFGTNAAGNAFQKSFQNTFILCSGYFSSLWYEFFTNNPSVIEKINLHCLDSWLFKTQLFRFWEFSPSHCSVWHFVWELYKKKKLTLVVRNDFSKVIFNGTKHFKQVFRFADALFSLFTRKRMRTNRQQYFR